MPRLPLVLVVDDEDAHREILERILRKEGYEAVGAAHGQQALDLIRARRFDLIITDLMMPGAIDGMDLLELARRLDSHVEVILMTAFGTVERAVTGMKRGAFDFITKPIKRATIVKSARLALERQALLVENRALKAELAGLKGASQIVGDSEALKRALETALQVARSAATVLLNGESGTGKELFARLIRERSERASYPFIAVNCAALPESILEAELFGYEKGAFTGATARRIGRFEAAHNGTLFLDEVGELDLGVQAKLLRALQEGTIERLGSNDTITVDARVVAATNTDLREAMAEGVFREDLYYRLNVVPIEVPPLRHRTGDVPLLVHHFLARACERNRREVRAVSAEAMAALSAYEWPGNVRELENAVERAVVLDRDGVLGTDDLPETVPASQAPPARQITVPLGTPLEEIERRVIDETLTMVGGNKRLAAKLLGIATRTIYRKL